MTAWKTNIADPNLEIVWMDFGNPPSDADPAIYLTTKRDVIGISFQTKRDGTWLRAAVEMRREPSVQEISEAFSLLMKAYTDPESPDVKVVRGNIELTPNVMQTAALLALNEVKSK